MTDLKLGKAPARPRPKDITLGEVVARGVVLPAAPVGFGHAAVYPAGGCSETTSTATVSGLAPAMRR